VEDAQPLHRPFLWRRGIPNIRETKNNDGVGSFTSFTPFTPFTLLPADWGFEKIPDDTTVKWQVSDYEETVQWGTVAKDNLTQETILEVHSIPHLRTTFLTPSQCQVKFKHLARELITTVKSLAFHLWGCHYFYAETRNLALACKKQLEFIMPR